ELPPTRWEPGDRPIGLLDNTLIGVGSAPLNPDGSPSAPLEFSAGPVSIGWGPKCTIRVPRVPGVAREHARFWLRGGRLTVHNLVDGHSTLVSRHPVIWDFVEPGSWIDIGPYRFRCIDVSSDHPARVPASAMPRVTSPSM